MLVIRPRITPYFAASKSSQSKTSDSPPPQATHEDLFTRVAKARAATRNWRIELKKKEPNQPWITGPRPQCPNKAATPTQQHLISIALAKALARLPQINPKK